MPDNKTFYLIAGPNGSGKTTLAKQIIKNNSIEILNLDCIAESRDVSSITAARQLLVNDLPNVLALGRSFVLESTLSGTYDARIIKMARDMNYRVVLIFAFLSSVEQNIERVAQRVCAGGHDVDVDIIRRRYEKSLHNFNKIVPIVDKWVLFYNGEDGKSCRVASGTNDKITIENREFYSVFCTNCFDASVRRLIHFAEIGASEARLIAEGFGTTISFDILEKMINSRQR